MANQFLNTNWVSMEILRLLLNKLEIADYFNSNWEGDFEKEYAVGSSITVKFPWLPTVADGMGYQPQAITRISTTINLDQWMQIAFEWDDYEKAVKLERSEEQLRENYYEPAATQLAQEFDSRCAKFAYQNASNLVGALGTNPTTVQNYQNARGVLKKEACPDGRKCMAISTDMMSALTGASGVTSIFHPGDEITRAWKEGYIGKLAGFDFFESNSLFSHTAGTWASTVSVNGGNQSGTSLTITATSGDTFNVGDKFSIGSGGTQVNMVNPRTRRIAGAKTARTFTITQALTAAGGGTDVINFLPAIYGPGSQYQNVDALPASGAALTLWPGTNSPNGAVGTVGLGLSKYGFAKVGGKLYLPKAVEDRGQATDPDTGLSIRLVRAWDPVRSMNINRYDSLFGFGNLYQAAGAVCVLGA